MAKRLIAGALIAGLALDGALHGLFKHLYGPIKDLDRAKAKLEETMSNDQPTFYLISEKSCGPCEALKQHLKSVPKGRRRIVVTELTTQDNAELIAWAHKEYGIFAYYTAPSVVINRTDRGIINTQEYDSSKKTLRNDYGGSSITLENAFR